ncbi:molybdopterin-dependent oxidoreductase [Caenispirillum bisanense]|uniref:molybdopterin-dependent oxidoreductase n=1 Tax=Caenispirillum bisanense TaxID=414052 RepID=UPI0031E2546E
MTPILTPTPTLWRSLLPTLVLGCLLLLATAAVAVAAGAARPQPVTLPPLPPGPPVLTVAAEGGARAFSVAELEALGLHALEVDLLWQGESDSYQGVLLADVLRVTGLAAAEAVEVEALDGYRAVIPRADIEAWSVLLATRRAGRPMSVREKGPLRILYAMTPEQLLAAPQMDTRWVWMVRAIRPATTVPAMAPGKEAER